MTHTYTNYKWTLEGETKFDDSLTLLNPTMTIRHIVIHDGQANVGLKVTENGGVFEHSSNVRFATTESDVNAIVDAAMAAAFPSATKAQISAP